MEAPQPELLAARRRRLVDELAGRGIADQRVLAAIGAVPRHEFCEPAHLDHAYEDRPLPIGGGQTISQPYIVALMAEAAEVGPEDRVLEVGTGSGYGAAILGQLARSVVTVERRRELADAARLRLAGQPTVRVVVGDGSQGWPPSMPYDAIVVTASPRRVPPALVEQLADGGRLVIPVGRRRRVQTLVRLRRRGERFEREDLAPVRFVPLVDDTN